MMNVTHKLRLDFHEVEMIIIIRLRVQMFATAPLEIEFLSR
jgi:hypothetical protein